ncbi:hypothetical protein KAR91_50725 [Candidatus Pacearchaeota archaeon]|nr:hypothetical protein [Candidatus Pacearchaeota archaeon]
MSNNTKRWVLVGVLWVWVAASIFYMGYRGGKSQGLYISRVDYETAFNDGRRAEEKITSLKYRWGFDEGYKSGQNNGSAIPVSEWKDVFDVVCECGNHLHAEPCDIENYEFVCRECDKVYQSGKG